MLGESKRYLWASASGKGVAMRDLYEEEERIREILGVENLLDNLEDAMGTDMLEDLLAYICRCHDIKTTLKEKQ